MFGYVKLLKNADLDKYKYNGYGIGFDSRSEFSFTDESYGKNVTFFGTDMNSSIHVDNKGKDILILGKEPTQRLHGTTFTAVNTIMEATVSCLLMLQKYINSKQKS